MFSSAGNSSQAEAAMGDLVPPWIPGGEHLQYTATWNKQVIIEIHPFISSCKMFPGAGGVPQPEAAMGELFPPWIPGGEHLR